MKIQSQICSVQQALRLKELGVEQAGYFSYVKRSEDHFSKSIIVLYSDLLSSDFYLEEVASAFTAAELGNMLPPFYITGRDYGSDYFCEDYDTFSDPKSSYGAFKTEAEARAYQLIHLIEENELEVFTVNARLLKS